MYGANAPVPDDDKMSTVCARQILRGQRGRRRRAQLRHARAVQQRDRRAGLRKRNDCRVNRRQAFGCVVRGNSRKLHHPRALCVERRHHEERPFVRKVDDLPGMRDGLSPKRFSQTGDHGRHRGPGSDRFCIQYEH
jgi:hypothetical protein